MQWSRGCWATGIDENFGGVTGKAIFAAFVWGPAGLGRAAVKLGRQSSHPPLRTAASAGGGRSGRIGRGRKGGEEMYNLSEKFMSHEPPQLGQPKDWKVYMCRHGAD